MAVRTAVVLTAGQGKRLLPVTRHRSKAMLPVAGKPLVARVISSLVEARIERVMLVYNPADRPLQDYFSQEPFPGVEVVVIAQPQPKGTADALLCAAPLLGEPFFLSACDNLVSSAHLQDLLVAWESSPASSAVLSLMPVDRRMAERTGIVLRDGDWIRRIVEKPSDEQVASGSLRDPTQPDTLISSLPLYIFSTRIVEYLADIPLSPRGEYEVQNAIQRLIEQAGMVRGVVTDWRLTLTGVEDLLALNRYFLETESLFRFPDHLKAQKANLIPPLFIEEGVELGEGSIIGPNVMVEHGCRIGAGVQLRDAVLLAGARVTDGAKICGQVIF